MKELIDKHLANHSGAYPIYLIYLDSGKSRVEFELLFLDCILTHNLWVLETGGSCIRIPGLRKKKGQPAEYDDFKFGGQKSMRFIRLKTPSEMQ